MPKFIISFGVQGADAGVNLFGHALLLFSRQEFPSSSYEVLNSFGFYSQPNTSVNPIISGIKSTIGLKVDLQDGHGVLRREKMHELDYPLDTVSFEVDEFKFNEMQNALKKRIEIERNVIKELNEVLKDSANGYTRWCLEQEMAKEAKRKPRLLPFHIAIGDGAHSCKSFALNFLVEHVIIDVKQRAHTVGSSNYEAFPRTSYGLQPSLLQSFGSFTKTIKKSATYYNRTWEDGAKLLWATSPCLPTTAAKVLMQNKARYEKINKTLMNLRKLEQDVHLKIIEIEKENNKDFDLDILRLILKEIAKSRESFTKSPLSSQAEINQDLEYAEKITNRAHYELMPYSLKNTFYLRVMDYTDLRKAALVLVLLLAAANACVGALAIATAFTAVSIMAVSLYGFFSAEYKLGQQKTNSDVPAFAV